jgi:hypothetical protein
MKNDYLLKEEMLKMATLKEEIDIVKLILLGDGMLLSQNLLSQKSITNNLVRISSSRMICDILLFLPYLQYNSTHPYRELILTAVFQLDRADIIQSYLDKFRYFPHRWGNEEGKEEKDVGNIRMDDLHFFHEGDKHDRVNKMFSKIGEFGSFNILKFIQRCQDELSIYKMEYADIFIGLFCALKEKRVDEFQIRDYFCNFVLTSEYFLDADTDVGNLMKDIMWRVDFPSLDLFLFFLNIGQTLKKPRYHYYDFHFYAYQTNLQVIALLLSNGKVMKTEDVTRETSELDHPSMLIENYFQIPFIIKHLLRPRNIEKFTFLIKYAISNAATNKDQVDSKKHDIWSILNLKKIFVDVHTDYDEDDDDEREDKSEQLFRLCVRKVSFHLILPPSQLSHETKEKEQKEFEEFSQLLKVEEETVKQLTILIGQHITCEPIVNIILLNF